MATTIKIHGSFEKNKIINFIYNNNPFGYLPRIGETIDIDSLIKNTKQGHGSINYFNGVAPVKHIQLPYNYGFIVTNVIYIFVDKDLDIITITCEITPD